MRIFSNFKDFYDFVVTEPDNKKVYNRFTKDVVFTKQEHEENPDRTFYSEKNARWYYHNIGRTTQRYSKEPEKGFISVVAFCDKLHQYFQYDTLIYWNYEDIPEKVIEDITEKRFKWYKWRTKYEDRLWTNQIDDMLHYKKLGWIENRHTKEPIKTDLNKLFDSPIVFVAHADYSKIIINPKLNELGFNKVITPTEAYQEIYNWIPYHEPETANNPDDMNRYESKGFDKKTSFRPNMK